MQYPWRSDAEVQEATLKLFEGVVPERESDLKALWGKYNPRFNIVMDAGSDGLCVMEAGAYRDVVFNHRAMRAFWLAAFIAWEAYLAIHKMATKGSTDLDRLNEMLGVFSRLLKEKDPWAVEMPDGVPEPSIYPDSRKYPQARAAAELATLAAGWAFLHEIRHIKHQQEGTSTAQNAPAEEQHEEELSCDEYATKFLLKGVDKFAKDRGEDPQQVRQKRKLGIYFAMFAMTLINVESWEASESHPAMQDRINATMKHMGGSGAGMSDAIAYAAFIGLWHIWPNAPGPFRTW